MASKQKTAIETRDALILLIMEWRRFFINVTIIIWEPSFNLREVLLVDKSQDVFDSMTIFNSRQLSNKLLAQVR